MTIKSQQPSLQVTEGGSVSPNGKWLADLRVIIETRAFENSRRYYEIALFQRAEDEQIKKTNFDFQTKPWRTLIIPVEKQESFRATRVVTAYPITWSLDGKSLQTEINGIRLQIGMKE